MYVRKDGAMTVKVIGGICVILGCGSVGFMKAAAHKRTESLLRRLISGLDFMQWELEYRRTPLPQLCSGAAEHCPGMVGKVFAALSEELSSQLAPDAQTCMNAALTKFPELPPSLRASFRQLGQSLGRFDLPGQLQGIEAIRQMTHREVEQLCKNKEARLRCYQALGLCAGAALVVLFL